MINKFRSKKTYKIAFSLLVVGSVGCTDPNIAVGLRSYNHSSNQSVRYYHIGTSMGPGAGPESGGGATMCCVTIPRKWRSGLKLKISWEYQGGTALPPPPPPQTKEIPLPEYSTPADLHIHFYNNKVIAVISTCTLEHPNYPIAPADRLPWEIAFTQAEAETMKAKGGTDNDCR